MNDLTIQMALWFFTLLVIAIVVGSMIGSYLYVRKIKQIKSQVREVANNVDDERKEGEVFWESYMSKEAPKECYESDVGYYVQEERRKNAESEKKD